MLPSSIADSEADTDAEPIELLDPLRTTAHRARSAQETTVDMHGIVACNDQSIVASDDEGRTSSAQLAKSAKSANKKQPGILKGLKPENILGEHSKPVPGQEAGTKRKRLTRNYTEQRKVNYDLKYHPVDKIMRPNYSATRRALAEGTRLGHDYKKTRRQADEDEGVAHGIEPIYNDFPRRGGTRKSTRTTRGKTKSIYVLTRSLVQVSIPSTRSSRRSTDAIVTPVTRIGAGMESVVAKPENLLNAPIGENWDCLTDFDKRLHNLQHGAPDKSTWLPLGWSDVADTLISKGFLSKEQYTAWGGNGKLRVRYELVRAAVHGDHADSEPRDPQDRPLYWAEDFDVFDICGSKSNYIHRNIPTAMQGIERFTAKEFRRTMKANISCQRDVKKTESDMVKNRSIRLIAIADTETLAKSSNASGQSMGAATLNDRTDHQTEEILEQSRIELAEGMSDLIVDANGDIFTGNGAQSPVNNADSVLVVGINNSNTVSQDVPETARLSTVTARRTSSASTMILESNEKFDAESVAATDTLTRNALRSSILSLGTSYQYVSDLLLPGLRTGSTPSFTKEVDDPSAPEPTNRRFGHTSQSNEHSARASSLGPNFLIHEDQSTPLIVLILLLLSQTPLEMLKENFGISLRDD